MKGSKRRDIIAGSIVLLVLIAVVVGIVFVCLPDSVQNVTPELIGSVYITIDCSTILDNKEKLDDNLYQYLPDDGLILARTEMSIYSGDTVCDVLKRVCKAKGIPLVMDISGTYIKSIQHFSERIVGDKSGWLYKIDGVFPTKSSAAYKVSDGMEIVYAYTCKEGDVDGKWEKRMAARNE